VATSPLPSQAPSHGDEDVAAPISHHGKAPQPTAAGNPDAASPRKAVPEPSRGDGCQGATRSDPPQDRPTRRSSESDATPRATAPDRTRNPTFAAATLGSVPAARSPRAAAEPQDEVPEQRSALQVGSAPAEPASSTRDGPRGGLPDARRGGPPHGGCDRHVLREDAPRMASRADSEAVKRTRGKALPRVRGKADLPGNPRCPSDSYPPARWDEPGGILRSGLDAAQAAATESAAPRLAGPRTSHRTSTRDSTGPAVEAVRGWSEPAAGTRARGFGVLEPVLEPMQVSDDARATGDVPAAPASCAVRPSPWREPELDAQKPLHRDAREPVRNPTDAPPCLPCAPARRPCHPPGTSSSDGGQPSSAGRHPARRSHPPARRPEPTRQSIDPAHRPRSRSAAPP